MICFTRSRLFCLVLGYLILLIIITLPVTAAPGWKFHADVNNSGVYNDSGIRPNNIERWNYTTGGIIYSSPAVVNGVVYIGSNDNKIYAFNASTGTNLWNVTFGGSVSSSPAVINGSLFVGSNDNKIYALNATTGAPLWNFTSLGGIVYSSPAVDNGTVYFGSNDFNLTAVNATTGTKIWNFTTADAVRSSPAVVKKVVYFGSNDNKMYAVNATTGKQIWKYTTGGQIQYGPAVDNNTVYFGSLDKKIYALNATTGSSRWNITTGGLVFSTPAVTNNIVFIGGEDKQIRALNANTGIQIWNYTTGSDIDNNPAVANGVVYFGCSNNVVSALNASTGAFIWNYTTGNSIGITSPAVSNGVLYIGSWDKKVYALGASPVANFTANITSGAPPLIVQFNDTSTGFPSLWNWSFGDGTFSTSQNPAHNYSFAGTFTVSLNATDGHGSNIMTRTGYIIARITPPVANFTANVTSGAAPLPVLFTDLSLNNATGWAWFFGDENFTAPWTRVNASSGWSARYNLSTVAMPDGSIVLMGGTDSSGNKNDTWRSTDNGAKWTRVNASSGWPARSAHSSVAMPDGSIILMGGFNSSTRYNDTWRSTDNGAKWTRVNASSGWTARYAFSSVATPDGSIVLMGGNDGNLKNDTWRSTNNGTTWTLMNASSGWSARYNLSSVATPDGSIVLLGGNETGGNKNDTWRSTDYGATWTQVNASSGWPARSAHSSVAMPDGSIVLMGGFNSSTRYNDTWRSTNNGAIWTRVNASSGWTARYAFSSVAMPNGSIILMGGNDGNLKNDTWRFMPVGSSLQNASHTYTASGTYQVALQVYNGGGYNSTRKAGYITVSAPPVASFTANVTSGTKPLTVQFNDTSINTPTSWNWSFGDATWFNTTSSASANATHTYSNAGTYTVNLTAGNSAGSNTSSRSNYIVVTVPKPIPNFIANVTSGTAPLPVSFTDLSLNTPTGWAWFFGDENFTAPWMQVNASSGWTARYGQSSMVMPDGSIVLIGGNDGGLKNDTWRSINNGATWTLVNASSGWSARPRVSSVAMTDGSIVLMGGYYSGIYYNDTWRSTDNGATWSLVNASSGWSARYGHSSIAMPDGSIVLIGGEDSGGYTNDTWRSTNNGAMWTLVNASSGWSPREGQTSVAMPDGSIVLMGGYSTPLKNDVWRSTNNGATWTQVNASAGWTARYYHTSVAMPDGSIVLTGGFDSGNPKNDTWRSTDNGATWSLVNASSGWSARYLHSSIAMPDGSIALIGGNDISGVYRNDTWRFMPTGSSLQNPSHTYTAAGNYSVALQAYNAGGYNSTRKTGYITVTGTPVPVADFTATPLSGAKPLTVVFTDLSVTSPTTWNWNFGDGNTTNATVQNPVHAYLTPGIYTVSLNVTNSSGFNATAKTNYIWVDFANVAMFLGDRQHTGVYSDGGIAPTNNLKWSYPTLQNVESSPIIVNGVVYFGSNDFNLTAVNASTGAKLWNFTSGSGIISSPAVADGTVYFGSYDHNLYAVNASTGTQVWNFYTGAGLQSYVYSSPAVANGYVYFGSVDGKFYSLFSNNGSMRWSYTAAGPIHSSPAIADDVVYFGGDDYNLTALYATNGTKKWNYATLGSIISSPAVANGIVYIPSGDYNITALNASAGTKLWNFTTGNGIQSSPAVANGVVYVGSDDYNLYALNATTGVKIWSFATGLVIHSSPAVANSTVYFGSNDGILYAVNTTNGLQKWTYVISNPITSSPAVANGTVYFGSMDHKLYALGGTTTPIASFTANVTSGTKPLAVNFTDLSTNTPISWNWSFGDGNISVLQNPAHLYEFNGTFTVSLNATNAGGSNVSVRTNYIIVTVPKPIPNFTANVTSGSAPLPVSFTDLSLNTPTGWAWFFGDENFTAPWTQVNASSGWAARTLHSSVVMPDGSIVLMGGDDGSGNKKNDTWRSTNNGATWTQQTASAGWSARYGHTSVAMPDGSIVLMGGQDSIGNFNNDTWRSTDNGKTWSLVNASSGWSARKLHKSVVLPDGSIVLMGGGQISTATFKNDVWRSIDNGASWMQVNSSSGWLARELHSSVVMADGSIVLMGGYDNGAFYKHDVWRSVDNGATWTQVNASAEWSGRDGHSSVAMPDGSIVLMGGFEGGNYLNDVWRSTDNGATWTQVNASAEWSGRNGHSSMAMPDGSIVLMGGFSSSFSYMNDVWRLMPAGSSAQSPSHTYTTAGTYQVALQAFNAGGYNSTRKAGYITVTGSLAPAANFTANTTYGTAPLAVQFTDTSIGPGISSWKWNFTTGGTIADTTSQNPIYTYVTPGNYTVNLTVTNSSGSDSEIKASYITVNAPYIDVSVNGSINNWNFVTGTNEDLSSVNLTIDTNINQWIVDAKDALDNGKPAGTEGKMAEWSGSSYVSSGKVLLNAIQVKYGTGNYLTLSGTDQLIKSGTSPGYTDSNLGINQLIAPTDSALSVSNKYRIVVTFTGSAV